MDDFFIPTDSPFVKSFGCVKVNSRNYEVLKKSNHEDVIYNEAMQALLIGETLVVIDDSLTDDVGMYCKDFFSPPVIDLYSPPPVAAMPKRPLSLIQFSAVM